MQRYFRQPLPNFVDSLVRSFGRAEGKTPAKPFIFDPNFAIMKKTIVPLFCALFGLSLATTSCQDMLTPDLDRYAENFSGKDTVNFYFGILNNVQGMIEQNVLLGELRGDLVKPTEFVSDSINDIINFNNLEDGENALLNRAAYYKVINQCNFYLAKADSMALKNNSYYMRRELAQVQLVRAWTYMQLVQLYGSVPFITDPVSTSDTGWEKNPPLGWATPSNLLSLLEDKGGLKQAYAYTKQLGYPRYGNFNNGAENFDQRLSLFNANLVYADLYLLRGANKGDYEQAASYYYKFLKEDTKSGVSSVATVNHFVSSAGDDYFASILIDHFAGSSSMSSAGEIVGAVPTASNSFFGQVLTRIPQVYGFDATSSNSTTTRKEKGTDGKEKNTTSTTGTIELEANYRNRQVEPSAAYTKLNEAQTVVYSEREGSKIIDVRYPKLFDARYDATVPRVITDKGRLRFIQKFNPAGYNSTFGVSPKAFSFRYGIPTYRLRQIYLRYAEAVNRAGYPRYAFDILRTGLDNGSMPVISKEVQRDTVFTDDTHKQIASITEIAVPTVHRDDETAMSIDLNSLIRAGATEWLDFTTEDFNKENTGIHVAGCGKFPALDSVWVYNKVVAQRMVDEAARQGKTIAKPNLSVGGFQAKAKMTDTTEVTAADGSKYFVYKGRVTALATVEPSAAEIAAMETLLADEYALETAFEGNRFFDLMRLQQHRNVAGDDTQANSWLAWRVSRRDLDLLPYEQPTKTGTLFSKLLNQENWYLPAPRNK